MDAMTELATLFRDRDNKPPSSMTTGIIISPPPEAKIRLNDVVVLENRHLIWTAHMLSGYTRNIKLIDNNCGVTTVENDGGMGASSHSHDIKEINIDTLAEWTDTVVEGDEVIIMPVADNQLYFVLDKAVRFE